MIGRRVAAGDRLLVGVLIGAGFVTGRAASISLTSQALTPYRTCTLTATPATATVETDTTARQGSATSNFGTLTTLTVSSASAANQRTYLRFDLTRCSPAIPATAIIRLATLRLFVSALPAVCRTVDLFPVDGDLDGSGPDLEQPAVRHGHQQPGRPPVGPAPSTSGRRSAARTGTNNSYVVGGTVTTDVAAFVAGAPPTSAGCCATTSKGRRPPARPPSAAKNLGHRGPGSPAGDHLRGGPVNAGRVGLALLIALLAAWFGPAAVSSGGSVMYIVIRGNSMEPGYVSGDLLVVRAEPSYGTSDVVAYRVPGGEVGEGIVVVHRIVGGDASAGFGMPATTTRAPIPGSRTGPMSSARPGC